MHASHVVVDTTDGYTFCRGANGELFTEITARQFCDQRNAGLNRATYELFELVSTVKPIEALNTQEV